MLKSMTGFSSTTITLPDKSYGDTGVNITMTLKSLNSRFFEFNCKVPFALNQLEADLIKYFKTKLHRGNIYFTLYMSNPNALNPSVKPSFSIISNYINSINTIQKEFQIKGDFTIKDLISLPNVFENSDEPISKSTLEVIYKTIEKLADDLIVSQIKEGLALKNDLEQRIDLIQTHLNELEPRSSLVIEERKKQLAQAINTALVSSNIENIQETQSLIIYNQIEKIDIHEEIVRFKTHLDNLKSHINSTEPEKGKKIDFILQELFREINTIASKCSDAKISNIAINIKVELEKAREQAQNII